MAPHPWFPTRLVPVFAALAAWSAPARAAEVDRYLPADTAIVVNVNTRQLIDSPLVKKHALGLLRDALKGTDMAEDILKDLGFDPFKDLDRVIAAGPGGPDKDRGLLIAHGRFDPAKFKAKAEESAKTYGDVLKIHKLPAGAGGHLVYEVNTPELPMPVFVALAGPTTLLASPGKDYVVDALKKGPEARAALKDKDLQALLEKVDGGQSVSLAAAGDALKKTVQAEGGAEDVGATLDKITALGGGVTLGEDIKVEVVVTAKNAAEAREFRDTADQGIRFALAGLAVLGKGDEPRPGLDLLLEVIKSLKVSVKDRSIVIKGKVSAEAIEDTLKKDKDK
jgi:hypothetical protein